MASPPALEHKSIQSLIITIRDKPVLLDSDLAALFGTETKKLNQQVKRNIARFDEQFAFQLTREEFALLKSQDGTASGHGGRRTPPWAFTEHGVAMAATVLTSPRAIEALKLIIDVFVASRRQMTSGAAARREDTASRTRRERIREKLTQMTEAILNAEINRRDSATVKDEVDKLTTAVLDNVKAQLASKAISNEAVIADIHQKMAAAEKTRAEARKTHAEADQIDLRNLRERLSILRAIEASLESQDVRPMLDAMDAMSLPPSTYRALPAPSDDKKN
ncbi:MAG: ORF6N domain-containing protein [Rhizobiaceae bacterium]